MANSRVALVFVLSILSLATVRAFSKTSCKSITKKTFDNCIDLPTLNAVLQYTYNPVKCTLSMAFTAPPPDASGWVAWALNPKSLGMVGAQTLLAYKPKKSGPVTVSTLDIASYSDIIPGPISYNVTGLSTQQTNGETTICATWVIPRGQKFVNMVWQVGPVVDGQPGVHAFETENLGSTMKLSLVATGPTAGVPAISPGNALSTTFPGEPVASVVGGGKAPAPAPAPAIQSGGAQGSVVSVVMVLSALLVFFM